MSAHMRPAPGPRPGGPGGPGGLGMTLPAEKAKDFKGTFRRLLRRLRPERVIIAVVLGLAVVSVFFQVLGPWLLGQATNVIFGGVVGKMIPPGVSKEQAIAGLQARGENAQADMLASMTLTDGVDFTKLGRIIALVVVVYFISSVFS